MAGIVQVQLFDQNKQQVALFDKFRSLTYEKRVNNVFSYSLVLTADDDRISLFEDDGIIEIYRADPEQGVDWYLDFEGFHMSEFEARFESGDKTWTSFGRGYNDLLRRRIIAWYATSAEADKSGVGETVMKEYVDENAGPSATIAGGRLGNFDGAFPGFTVEADTAQGGNWDGSRSYKNLLETLQTISNQTSIDFQVVGTGVSGIVPQFEFRTYVNQLGTDRSKVGVDPTTGLNASGQVPVEFSIELGNVDRINYSLSRLDEATSVFSLGQGTDLARTVRSRESADRTLSPWNLKEVSRNANQQSTNQELDDFADEWLDKLMARENFSFTPKRAESTVYGRDYFLGDRVTVSLPARNITRSKRIVGVLISHTEDGEDIRIEFQDIPE